MLQDVSTANRSDRGRVDDPVASPTLETIHVVSFRDLGRVRFGAVPEHENRRNPAGRTERRPIRLSGFREFAFDDVMTTIDHRHLRNCAAAPLKRRHQVLGELRKRRRLQANDLSNSGVPHALGDGWALSYASDGRHECQRDPQTTHASQSTANGCTSVASSGLSRMRSASQTLGSPAGRGNAE